MGRRIPKTVIFRGFTGIFTALMVLTGSIRSVALDWEDKVNELLGTSGADVERSQNPEDYMYPSDFGTVEELVEAEIGNGNPDSDGRLCKCPKRSVCLCLIR